MDNISVEQPENDSRDKLNCAINLVLIRGKVTSYIVLILIVANTLKYQKSIWFSRKENNQICKSRFNKQKLLGEHCQDEQLQHEPVQYEQDQRMPVRHELRLHGQKPLGGPGQGKLHQGRQILLVSSFFRNQRPCIQLHKLNLQVHMGRRRWIWGKQSWVVCGPRLGGLRSVGWLKRCGQHLGGLRLRGPRGTHGLGCWTEGESTLLQGR